MKKSNYTVTIPLIDFEQFQEYKTKYEELTAKLKNCFKCENFQIDGTIRFDDNEALSICKEFLGYSYKSAMINK